MYNVDRISSYSFVETFVAQSYIKQGDIIDAKNRT